MSPSLLYALIIVIIGGIVMTVAKKKAEREGKAFNEKLFTLIIVIVAFLVFAFSRMTTGV